MMLCKYCGRATGFDADEHNECRERHQRAVALIPGFFAKALENPIPAGRFYELIEQAAQSSFVDRERLKSLAFEGLATAMSSILDDRLTTAAQTAWISELLNTQGSLFADEPGLEETLIKIEILRDLGGGKIPDRIEVSEPLPMTLRRGETILWIFNGVSRLKADRTPQDVKSTFLSAEPGPYHGLRAFAQDLLTAGLVHGRPGDLVLTSHKLYFLAPAGKVKGIPIARIAEACFYRNAIELRSPSHEQSWAFAISDPWFLANALSRLMKLQSG